MILLGSLLIIPISAVEEAVVVDNYVIPAGEYRFNDVLTDFSSFVGQKIYFDFVANGASFDYIYFFNSSSFGGSVIIFYVGGYYIYLNGSGYIQNGELYRDITVTSDANVSEEFYNWFFDNVNYDQPDPPSAFDHILSIFTAISDWFLSSFGNVIPMFYASGEFTLLGYIFLLPLAFCVVYAFLNYVIACLLFRR